MLAHFHEELLLAGTKCLLDICALDISSFEIGMLGTNLEIGMLGLRANFTIWIAMSTIVGDVTFQYRKSAPSFDSGVFRIKPESFFDKFMQHLPRGAPGLV